MVWSSVDNPAGSFFLSDHNIKYPVVFDESSDTCVIVKFTINKHGKIKDVAILQSAGKKYDKEVLKAIALMPDWIPGINEGKNASMEYSLSIYFKIN